MRQGRVEPSVNLYPHLNEIMSSSARLQKLRERRSRANATKAAVASSSSTSKAPASELTAHVDDTQVGNPSWVKSSNNKQVAPSKTTMHTTANIDKSRHSDTIKNSDAMVERDQSVLARAQSLSKPNSVSASSFILQTTSSVRPQATTDSSDQCAQLKPPKSSDSNDFRSAKSRFETSSSSSTSTSGSTLSGYKKSHATPKKHSLTFDSNHSCKGDPWKRNVYTSSNTNASIRPSQNYTPHKNPPEFSKLVTPTPTKRMTVTPAVKQQFIGNNGTPIWIHASLLKELGVVHNGWEWIRAYVQSSFQDSIKVLLADEGCFYTVAKRDNLILMGNSWWSTSDYQCNTRHAASPTSVTQLDTPSHHVPSAMPPGDLVELAHLHEPATVYSLRARYEQDLIYTYTGAVLLALNPFKKLDHLYTREIMELYWTKRGTNDNFEMHSSVEGDDKQNDEKPPPHAYAVAERAFSSMLRSMEERAQFASSSDLPPCDQSILVSGESGAGKTVTTKIIMRYLTILSQRRVSKRGSKCLHGNNQSLTVENQVLQSNPVLESFGNARTIRNDNSSRFGKYIDMIFDHGGALLGASINFYLLEKVRLVSVNPGERNYHVFYEVLSSGMSLEEKKRYMLTSNFGRSSHPASVNDFYMTSVSGTFDRSRDGVQDCHTYRELRNAMNIVGINTDEQDGIFCVVAALLHASNLKFISKTKSHDEECILCEKDGTLRAVASLLGVPDDALKFALTSSVIEARGERLTKKLSIDKAEKALEALVKATYAGLFAYIVMRINESIKVNSSCRGGNDGKNHATIGLLDIFGFECFDTNSFERKFCLSLSCISH